MTQQYPKGYWSSVFDQAAYLMNQRSGLSGETAYWLARRLIDRGLSEAGHVAMPVPPEPVMDLVLSP